jgi:hypothetical protein
MHVATTAARSQRASAHAGVTASGFELPVPAVPAGEFSEPERRPVAGVR